MPVTALSCAGAIRQKPSPAFLAQCQSCSQPFAWFTCRDSFLCQHQSHRCCATAATTACRIWSPARIVLDAGADGITVHPRPDERHIRASDMQPIAALVRGTDREFNVEGNPHHNLVQIVEEPCRGEPCSTASDAGADALNVPTSNRGFAAGAEMDAIAAADRALQGDGNAGERVCGRRHRCRGCRRAAGADRMELTPSLRARVCAGERRAESTARVALARSPMLRKKAREIGLRVNAGHDLNCTICRCFLA